MQPQLGLYDEPPIAQVGEVVVTSSTIRTPAGVFPLRGSQWMVTDQWTVARQTPTWAKVLAITLIPCTGFLSLLILLAKEDFYLGTVTVTITNGPAAYVARIPVASPAQVQHIYNQVNYVRSISLI
ncbi:MAG TPA: hypothetical protein VH442_17380 [Micromonosporaceae bacterium]|jgi:hypothetical protein